MYWLLLTALAATDAPKTVGVPAFGGGVKCEKAFSPENREMAQTWSLGFWTGLNVGRSEPGGVGLDAIAIGKRVEATCAAQPSLQLIAAVIETRKAAMVK